MKELLKDAKIYGLDNSSLGQRLQLFTILFL